MALLPTQFQENSNQLNDELRPLTYEVWVNYNRKISDPHGGYNRYVRQWFENYYTTQESQQTALQTHYLELIQSLQPLSRSVRDLSITTLDLSDPFELHTALPHITTYVKQIALYYAAKRHAVKNVVVRNSTIGSVRGLENDIRTSILSTVRWNEGEVAFVTAKPLTQVTIIPLIDDATYHDVDPDNYDSSNDELSKFVTNLYGLSATNPLIFSVADYIAQFSTALVENIPASAFSDDISRDYLSIVDANNHTGNTLGTDALFVKALSPIADPILYTLDIPQGTSVHIWPFGKQSNGAARKLSFDSVSIHNTNFISSGSTAGSSIDVADVMWVTTDDDIQAAWLNDFSGQFSTYETTTIIKANGTTSMRFPFAGIGTVDNDGLWTGPQLSNVGDASVINTPQYDLIQSSYWSETLTLTACEPISIHDTTLIVNGARGSSSSFYADRITASQNGVISNIFAYKPYVTQLLIKAGTIPVIWPLFAGPQTVSPPFEIALDQCAPIALSAIDTTVAFRGAIASTAASSSDIITVYECNQIIAKAWLSAGPVANAFDTPYVSGGIQGSLSIKLVNNAFTSFVYDDPSRKAKNINDIPAFLGVEHDNDCPYPAIAKSNINAPWGQCKCKAVHYSPLGHDGATFRSRGKFADAIMLDTQFPEDPNIEQWRDSAGRPITTSNQFAWFRITSSPEGESGWATGEWVTHTGAPFEMVPGQKYTYWRSPQCCGFDSPDLIINHAYCDCPDPQVVAACNNCINPFDESTWISCDCNPDPLTYCYKPSWKAMEYRDGAWYETSRNTDIVLEAGTTFDYLHQDRSTIGVTASAEMDRDAIDFFITQPLSGWNDTTNSYSVSARGAKPFWANVHGILCADNLGGDHEYLTTIQPNPSTLVLNSSTTIDFKRGNTASMVWAQPISISSVKDPAWCSITIDALYKSAVMKRMMDHGCTVCLDEYTISSQCGCTSAIYDLTETVQCTPIRISVIADHVLSPIILNSSSTCGGETVITYCAKNGFSTTHALTRINLPTNLTTEQALLIAANSPWANMTNRHFPTVASSRRNNQLYPVEDAALFAPDKLKIWQYSAPGYFNTLVPDGSGSYVIVDQNIWANDHGLSLSNHNEIVDTVAVDSSYLKNATTHSFAAGNPTRPNNALQFIAYQTLTENTGYASYGFIDSQYTRLTPFDETTLNLDASALAINFYDYANVAAWITNDVLNDQYISNWAVSVYGDQFMLLKTASFASVADKRDQYGSIYVRTIDGTVGPLSSIAPAIHSKCVAVSAQLVTDIHTNGVKQIELVNDTLVVVTSSHVVIDRLVPGTEITALSHYASIIPYNLYGNANDQFAGMWSNEAGQCIVLCTLVDNGNSFVPHLYSYSLVSGKLNLLYPKGATQVADWTSETAHSTGGTSLCYNPITKTIILTAVDQHDVLHIGWKYNSASNVELAFAHRKS